MVYRHNMTVFDVTGVVNHDPMSPEAQWKRMPGQALMRPQHVFFVPFLGKIRVHRKMQTHDCKHASYSALH